jgi:hypothetical protein
MPGRREGKLCYNFTQSTIPCQLLLHLLKETKVFSSFKSIAKEKYTI